jgi:hypothetical protein
MMILRHFRMDKDALAARLRRDDIAPQQNSRRLS